MASPHLTKSRHAAGLQCLRRLWLLVHEPQEHEEPSGGSPLQVGHHAHRVKTGSQVLRILGVKARCAAPQCDHHQD